MQPYFLPYIRYWQVFASFEKSAILDDVNYITRGRINRNRIVTNWQPKLDHTVALGAKPASIDL